MKRKKSFLISKETKDTYSIKNSLYYRVNYIKTGSEKSILSKKSSKSRENPLDSMFTNHQSKYLLSNYYPVCRPKKSKMSSSSLISNENYLNVIPKRKYKKKKTIFHFSRSSFNNELPSLNPKNFISKSQNPKSQGKQKTKKPSFRPYSKGPQNNTLDIRHSSKLRKLNSKLLSFSLQKNRISEKSLLGRKSLTRKKSAIIQKVLDSREQISDFNYTMPKSKCL